MAELQEAGERARPCAGRIVRPRINEGSADQQLCSGLPRYAYAYRTHSAPAPQAEALFACCQAVQQRLGLPPGPGHSSDPQLGLGLLASLRGDYAEARQLLEQAQRAAEQTGHRGNALVAAYFLAGIHLAQGQYLAAQAQAEAAYAAVEAADNRWFMAYCLIELGNAAQAQERYAEAQSAYQASYELRAIFDDPEGMATALAHQSAVALDQGDLATAAAAYQRSHLLYREIDDHGGLVTALEGLGRVACARGWHRVTCSEITSRRTSLAIAA